MAMPSKMTLAEIGVGATMMIDTAHGIGTTVDQGREWGTQRHLRGKCTCRSAGRLLAGDVICPHAGEGGRPVVFHVAVEGSHEIASCRVETGVLAETTAAITTGIESTVEHRAGATGTTMIAAGVTGDSSIGAKSSCTLRRSQ